MGLCCSSGEEEAKETALAAPIFGQPLEVKLKKQGTFDADYDVINVANGQDQVWMLIDAVGGLFSGGYTYYLKHRMAGQEESTVLGAGRIDDGDTQFGFVITDGHRRQMLDFDSDSDDFSDDPDTEWEINIATVKHIRAEWKMIKVCRLFKDKEMTQPLGTLSVKSKGVYRRMEKDEIEIEFDDEGNRKEKHNHIVRDNCNLKAFHYKFEVMNTPIQLGIMPSAEGGSFWRRGHRWQGVSSTGAQLFDIIGDGRNATVKTCPGSDPASTLLAAFAVACKFDPAEVQQKASSMCSSRIRC